MIKKILVLIYSQSQVRTFVQSDAFSKLENSKSYDVSFVFVNARNIKLESLSSNQIRIRELSLFLKKSGTYLSTALLWRNREKSMAHLRRANATLANRNIRRESSYQSYVPNNAFSGIQRMLIRSLAIKCNYYFTRHLRKAIANKYLTKSFEISNISIQDYSCAIVPFSGLLSHDFDDYINFFNTFGVYTIAVQENWDHLSSKTFIDSPPNHFCVWGKQSIGHLQIVHSLNPNLATIVGSPRMFPYIQDDKFENRNLVKKEVISNVPKMPYILFCGTGDGRDDFFLLELLIDTLHKSNKLQIVYRPHPNRRNNMSDYQIKHLNACGVIVNLDKISHSVFYHCELVINCELLITSLSTLLVEGLLCNKKVLVPCFSQSELNYDFSESLDTWLHLIGLRSFPNIFISETIKDFNSDILNSIEVPAKESATTANWICSRVDFSQVLFNLVEKLSK